jgi:hypothetical protein
MAQTARPEVMPRQVTEALIARFASGLARHPHRHHDPLHAALGGGAEAGAERASDHPVGHGGPHQGEAGRDRHANQEVAGGSCPRAAARALALQLPRLSSARAPAHRPLLGTLARAEPDRSPALSTRAWRRQRERSSPATAGAASVAARRATSCITSCREAGTTWPTSRSAVSPATGPSIRTGGESEGNDAASPNRGAQAEAGDGRACSSRS